MFIRRSLTLASGLLGSLVLATGWLAAEPPAATAPASTPSPTSEQREKPEKPVREIGLQVGNLVPVSSMRYIEVDRNGCYAGQFSRNRAISIYARTLDEPRLADLACWLEGRLKEDDELRGYILLLTGDQRNEGLKLAIRKWMQEHQLAHVKLAIANGTRVYRIDDETGIQVVDSDQRQVKFSRAFSSGKLDDEALKQIAEAVK